VPWRTIDGQDLALLASVQLEVLVKGIFERQRSLEYMLHFITFEDKRQRDSQESRSLPPVLGINKAVDCIVQPSRPGGDRRIGVAYRTQESRKSLSMAFVLEGSSSIQQWRN